MPSDSFVVLKDFITEGIPGANMEEARGEKKVIAEIIATTTPFRHNAQLRGFIGSSSPSHPILISRSHKMIAVKMMAEGPYL